MIKKLVIGIVFLILVVSASLFAQDEPGAPQEEPIQGTIDYTDEKTINELSTADLAAAIESGNIKIEDLSKITPENLVNALNERPVLATKLNDNQAAKQNFFSYYKITDEGAKIKSYDGTNVKTEGDESTTFAIKDIEKAFPGSKILANGRLVLKGGHEVSGTSKFYFKDGAIRMEGGKLNTKKLDFDIEVKNGEVKKELVNKGKIIYKGSFDFYHDSEGDHFSSTDQRGFSRETYEKRWGIFVPVAGFNIKGDILDPTGSKDEEFILEKETEIVHETTKAKLITISKSKVYFSQTDEKFCKSGYSCVVYQSNSYQKRIKFQQVENGDKIAMVSPVYHSKVEASNIKDGRVVYTSFSKTKDDTVKIEFGKDGSLNWQGNLNKVKIGSIDLTYSKNQKDRLKHYSTSGYQHEAVSNYFKEARTDYLKRIQKGESPFVDCELGNCESSFAKNFGKIIGPKGKKPTTTILVGGDFISTVTSKPMMNYCLKEGCYVLNSRDLPKTTDSTNLVVTGHKLPNEAIIWRDNPEQPLYGDSLMFSELPEKKSGKLNIFTSACNSALKPFKGEASKAFNTLEKRYGKNLGDFFGWSGTSPKTDIGIVKQMGANNIQEYQRPDKKGFVTGYVWKEKSPPKFPSEGYYWVKDQKSTPVLVKSG